MSPVGETYFPMFREYISAFTVEIMTSMCIFLMFQIYYFKPLST